MSDTGYSYPSQSSDFAKIQQSMDYYSNFRYMRLYKGGAVYRLHENVRSYLEQPFPSKEEKQKAHGNFIWAVKKYFRTPFQKEAVSLINANTKQLDIADKDKVNFLNYILTMKNFNCFSQASFEMLYGFSFDGDYMSREGRNVLHKMHGILDDKYKRPEEYREAAKRFYPYLDKYSREYPQVSHNLVSQYAGTLFNMSSQFPFERVSLVPLKNLMERTVNLKHSQVKMNNLFETEETQSKPQIDKKAVLKVIDIYAKHAQEAENKKINDTILYNSMSSMLSYIVQTYDYKPADIKAIREILGERHGSSGQRRLLHDMGRVVQKAYKDIQPRKFNPRNKTVDPLLRDMKGHYGEL